MKKFFVFMAAACCAVALSATTYTSHLKVTINQTVAEQDQVQVEVVNTKTLKNFVLVAEGVPMPVGNIEVSGVEGVDEFGYTTITFNGPINIAAGDDPQYDFWVGPQLGEVPLDMVARFTGTAMSANIDINLQVLQQIIGVQLFGVAPELKGDVNKDGEVTVADVNAVVKEIINQ